MFVFPAAIRLFLKSTSFIQQQTVFFISDSLELLERDGATAEKNTDSPSYSLVWMIFFPCKAPVPELQGIEMEFSLVLKNKNKNKRC